MKAVLLIAAAIVLGGGAHLAGERASAAQTNGRYDEDLMYLPEGRVLRMASLGHTNFVADLVWLSAIQYYGDQRLTSQTYEQAERLFQVIYDLDPHFKGATRFGALVLAQDAGNPEGAIQLLERAEQDNPLDWEYPFDRGFINHTIVHDFATAGESYRRASTLPDAPDLAARLAGVSFARLGDRQTARDVWLSLLDASHNEMLASIARRNLKNLDLDEAEELLTGALTEYRKARGGEPSDWRELVATGLLEQVPAEPWGGSFFWDEGTARVWSTTNVDRRMAVERDVFAGFALMLRQADGAWPDDLNRAVERGIVPAPPWRPFGLTLDYDAATGTVSWNPPWPEVEPGKHGKGNG